MFNSFDMAEEVFRCSPGDLLLAIMVKEMSARSIETFDLGLGEARYKDTWCEFIEPMYDSLVPVSLVGRAYALQASIGLRAARAIKQNPRLWAIAKRARAKVRGNRAAGRRPGP
jgi:CelD/BcsL family acetyltransferase involved in cellulose biosynthesis